MTKRLFDCLAATAGLLLLSPLLVLIAVAIKLDDGGPLLFTQSRLGERKRPFRIYKFRTMRAGRITVVGRWLRATGLDELAQLANVVVGDMSLIGPRPLTALDVTRLGWDQPRHARRWSVRPGLVGMAQLFAGRGKRLSWILDSYYVEHRSLVTNIAVVVLSAAALVIGKSRVRAWLHRRRRATRSARPERRTYFESSERLSARFGSAGGRSVGRPPAWHGLGLPGEPARSRKGWHPKQADRTLIRRPPTSPEATSQDPSARDRRLGGDPGEPLFVDVAMPTYFVPGRSPASARTR
jgi:lipopolysaccharide/colanic/teichoic acid biosynthesis glycosyltransferase